MDTEGGFSQLSTQEPDDEAETASPSIHRYFTSFSEPAVDDAKPRRTNLSTPITTYCLRWRCCRCCKREHIYDNLIDARHISTTQKAKEALMYEECLDATSLKLVEMSAWVNAIMLAVALRTTILVSVPPYVVDDPNNICINAWIFFAVIFAISVVSLFVPKCCVKTDSLKKELALKKDENETIEMNNKLNKNATLRDTLSARQEADQAKQSAEEKKVLKELRVFQFVEYEVNELARQFQLLTVSTLSNAVAYAWRTAAESTLVVIIGSYSVTSTVYFVYATVMTVFGVYFVVRVAQWFKRREISTIEYLDNEPACEEKERKTLLRFAFDQRLSDLLQGSVKFAIAWSWRMTINGVVESMYGTDTLSEAAQANPAAVVNQWGYTLIITLFVSVLYAVADDFYIVYPKNSESQLGYNTNLARTTANQLIYDNLTFVVGMSWFDSCMMTMKVNPASFGLMVMSYWLVALGGIVLSVVGAHYIAKWDLRKNIAERGLAQAMFDTFEHIYDPKCKIHDESDSDLVPQILDNMFFEILHVTINAWGIAGSLSVFQAITYTVYGASGGWDWKTVSKMDISLLWISAAVCLGVTLLITAYTGRLVNVIKLARRNMFEKLRQDKKKQLRTLRKVKPVQRLPMRVLKTVTEYCNVVTKQH